MPVPTGIVLVADDPVIVARVSGAHEDLVIVAGEGGGLVPLSLDDLTDVVITAPSTGQVVMYSGATWVNSSLPTYDLEALTDVDLTTPASGQLLQYNGSQWVNSDVPLDELSDVVITTPAAAQTLRYSGSGWVNSLLSLDDLSGVVITSDAVGHVLQHNGSAWINQAVLDMVAAATTTDSITVKVTGDSQKRLIINGDGKMEWGSGSATQDTNLYRSAADWLKTDDELEAVAGFTTAGIVKILRSAAGDDALRTQITGDTSGYRYVLNSDGKQEWGSGGTAAADTNLYRSAADTLKTDDTFLALNVIAGDSGWSTPSLGSGWNDFGGSFQTRRYRKTNDGMVVVEGLVKDGTVGTAIITLPSGYRPAGALIFATIAGNAGARLDVSTAGVVAWAAGGDSSFVSISCTFYAG
jgi:hypothetical protein